MCFRKHKTREINQLTALLQHIIVSTKRKSKRNKDKENTKYQTKIMFVFFLKVAASPFTLLLTLCLCVCYRSRSCSTVTRPRYTFRCIVSYFRHEYTSPPTIVCSLEVIYRLSVRSLISEFWRRMLCMEN